MKLLIIGSAVKDHIHIGNDEQVSPGGIFYSTLGATNFADENDNISLLTVIDKENESLFAHAFAKVNMDLITYTDKIPVVHLRISENTERCEYYENITQNLPVKNIPDPNLFDGILINMITGFDLNVEDILALRKKYNGLIYLDVHTLSRGLTEKNERVFRPIPEAEKWITSANFIQVNENEIFTLTDKKDESETAKSILKFGAEYLIQTKGELGARIFWLKQDELNSAFISALKVNAKNRVGLGDIFGAVFFSAYIKHQNLNYALRLANCAAGTASEFSNIDEFKRLKDDTYTRLN
jgi:sugar/nucleoside kinase (ribokinase family)